MEFFGFVAFLALMFSGGKIRLWHFVADSLLTMPIAFVDRITNNLGRDLVQHYWGAK